MVNPVKFYDNAEELKSLILLDNKNKSGIYNWENKNSAPAARSAVGVSSKGGFAARFEGEFYIGSAVDLNKRMLEYYRESYITHPSRGKSIICFALVKYGYSNFSLSILEYCDRDQVISREQFYLDLLNPPYNILKYAYSSEGYKHTLEAIQKMSLAKKGKFTKEDNSFYGKTHTEEVKELMSQAALKRIKPNNAKPVFLKDLNNNIIGAPRGVDPSTPKGSGAAPRALDFKSMTELSLYLKADKATLSKHRDSNKLFINFYFIVSKSN
jgi:group I intron endonuclease